MKGWGIQLISVSHIRSLESHTWYKKPSTRDCKNNIILLYIEITIAVSTRQVYPNGFQLKLEDTQISI